MPESYRFFDQEIRDHIANTFPARDGTRILDVGAGSGKYRQLLFDYPNVDAVEVWKPYIEKYQLARRYRRLWTGPAEGFPNWGEYDLVIFGDVLEHMTTGDAVEVVAACADAGCAILAAVPFEYEQGEAEGNPYEKHLQPDLTHALFMERYPGFRLLVRNKGYGIYFHERWEKGQAAEQAKVCNLEIDFEKLKQYKVAFATPVHGDYVTRHYLASMLKTQREMARLQIPQDLLMISGAVVCKARNLLVARFMAVPEYTHICFIDSDQGWSPVNVIRLLVMDREVIGVAARKKTTELKWAVNLDSDETVVDRGALEVAELGAGFLMIRREVFEKMKVAYPHLKITNRDPGVPEEGWEDHYYAFFQHVLEKDGSYRGEDLTFCKRWRETGGQVWADPQGDIVHVGSYEYSGAIESLIKGKA